jgi:hypothetical protein
MSGDDPTIPTILRFEVYDPPIPFERYDPLHSRSNIFVDDRRPRPHSDIPDMVSLVFYDGPIPGLYLLVSFPPLYS